MHVWIFRLQDILRAQSKGLRERDEERFPQKRLYPSQRKMLPPHPPPSFRHPFCRTRKGRGVGSGGGRGEGLLGGNRDRSKEERGQLFEDLGCVERK